MNQTANTAPMHRRGGEIDGAAGLSQDVTEQVQLPGEAQRLEREKELILSSAGEGIVGLDAEGRITFVNPAAAKMIGWSVEELVGQLHHETVHHSYADGTPYPWVECLVNATLEDGARYSVSDELFWRRDGTSFPVQYTSTPILEGDEVRGAVLVFRDITERVQAEETLRRLHQEVWRHADDLERQVRRRTAALEASQARFRSIFEDAAIGIALMDRQGLVTDSNPALQAMLGYSGEALRGRAFADLAHADDRAADEGLFGELVAGGRGDYEVEKRYVRKDGTTIQVHLTLSRVRSTGDGPRFAIAMVEDITERKQAQAALIESEKLALTGQLAASLAHEINNPLQSVIGCLALAEEIMEEGGDVRQYVHIAVEELERAARIVGRLRDLNRRTELEERTPSDVNALVERVIVLTQKQCQNQRVEVVREAGDDLPMVPLVPDRMPQVFLNLMLNAVDAMPEGGELRVRTARTEQPDGVSVTFADTGVGIAPEELSHLFEPFYSTRPGGLGLGLYVTRNIVEEHGGYIEVESQEEMGTTFTVWLPA